MTKPTASIVSAPQAVYRSLPIECVRHGVGVIEHLAADVDRLGGRRIFVITNRSLARQRTLLDRVERLLGDRHAGTFAAVRAHVPSSDVWAAAEDARHCRADLLVSFGGGSAIDCAKLVAFVLAGGVPDAMTLCRLATSHSPVEVAGATPHLAISTTVSAAEFSCAAGITDEDRGVKGVLVSKALAPRVVVLDPEVTLATPNALWLATGIKALDHAVERFCAPDHQPLIDVLCVAAARLLIENLPMSVADGDAALAARGQCQIGAWFSFHGWLNVRTGLSHVLGHQLGARFNVPHGHTSCVTLPHVIRLAHGAGSAERLWTLARGLGLDVGVAGAAAAVADLIAEMVADFDLPSRLRDVGVPRDQLDMLIAAASEEFRASGRIPTGGTPPDIASVVHAAW